MGQLQTDVLTKHADHAMQVSPLSHKLWAFGAAAVGSIVPALFMLLFHSVPKDGRN